METVDLYTASRARLLELAPSLSSEQQDERLAATPPWTVLDGYRHLTGVCVDFLDGRMDGAGTPAWTAAQLAARADHSLAEVCREWSGRAAEIDERMAGTGVALAFLAFDVWTHEQDIRVAAGQAGVRDGDEATALAALAARTFGPRYSGGGAPSIGVILDGQTFALGDGEVVATLETTSYEFLRIVFGRRSEPQIRAAGWSGDSEKPMQAIHLFDPPPHDISD